jgi:hypothetical protein
VTVDAVIQDGEFFDGDRFLTEITVGARPNRFVSSETTWEYNDIELPGGDFTTNIFRERLGLALNPRLRTDIFMQYNDLDELFGVNLRVNWIYKPGADLFFVYNHSWDAQSLSNLDRREREVIVKFTYLFQR